MKINALIKQLERLREKHGNLEVFYDGEVGPIEVEESEYVVACEDDYPDEWDIPDGMKFVLLG